MRRVAALAAFLLLIAAATADDTRLVPGAILEGEIAQLIIEIDRGIATLSAIDTSPLERDFRVLDVNSRVTRMIDDQENRFHRAQWRIQIAPRRTGRIAVPALTIGDRRSEAMVLEVRPASTLQPQHDVKIEVDVAPDNPYLGQEIRVTTRVLHGSGFDWARLAEPKSDEVARYQHGGDRRYAVERDGREYRVLERTQSLFPRRAGRLTLGEAEFRGRFGSGSGLDGRWLHRHSEALVLQVREPPVAGHDRPWIPARRVELDWQWAQPTPAPEPGEPVDFTLTLTAEGLAAEFLPAGLLARAGDGFNLFPDREQREDLLAGDALVGILVQRYALVATRAGEIRLPGIALEWWDTASDTARRASIAPSRLTIAEPQATVAGEAPASISMPASIAGALLAAGGLAALIAWWLARHGPLAGRLAPWRERRGCLRRLRRACRADDPSAAYAALGPWLRMRGEGVESDELRTARRDLEASLFAPSAAPWRGAALWRALRYRSPARGGDGTRSPALPALYPASRREPDAGA